MSQHDHTPTPSTAHTPANEDGAADVIATIAIIALVVSVVVFWLKSFAA
jgi:hypothetical protein